LAEAKGRKRLGPARQGDRTLRDPIYDNIIVQIKFHIVVWKAYGIASKSECLAMIFIKSIYCRFK
jgi:hypothetical protein